MLKTFQNLSVSSPAPVTMASPSGDTAFKANIFEQSGGYPKKLDVVRAWVSKKLDVVRAWVSKELCYQRELGYRH